MTGGDDDPTARGEAGFAELIGEGARRLEPGPERVSPAAKRARAQAPAGADTGRACDSAAPSRTMRIARPPTA